MLGAGDTGVNRTDIGLPSRDPGPLTSGAFPQHNIKQTEHPRRGRSAKLLVWRGLTHSLRIDAGFQINLHKIGPILLEQQINSSFYRLSNQPYSPLNLTANGAADPSSSQPGPAINFCTSSSFLPTFLSHLPSHGPSAQSLILLLVNTVFI